MPKSKFNAIVVDDETKARKNLRALLSEYCPEINVISDFSSGKEALTFLLRNKVDLLFLDIRMPEMNGFELLDNLKRNGLKTIVVSAHDDYGIQAVKAGAFDYLLKPLSIRVLRELVTRLERTEQVEKQVSDQHKISVPHGHGFKVVDLRTIMHIESDNSYSDLNFTEGNRLTVSCSIKEFEELLVDKGFFRIHNKHLINLRFLETFTLLDGGTVTLYDGTQLPVSRRRVREFKSVIKERFLTAK